MNKTKVVLCTKEYCGVSYMISVCGIFMTTITIDYLLNFILTSMQKHLSAINRRGICMTCELVIFKIITRLAYSV